MIQEHYGQVLFKLGRYDEAIAAWTRALAGDGDSIDKADVDKKIKAAKQKHHQEVTSRETLNVVHLCASGVLRPVASLLRASCGAPLMKLPAGPGAPAPDAADALDAGNRARAAASAR